MTGKVLEIQQILAVNENTFKSEAERNLLKAQRIMVQNDWHRVRELNEVAEYSMSNFSIPRWHGRIANILAKNFRCKSLWLWRWHNSKKIRVLAFIGFAQDIEVVKEAYTYFFALLKYNLHCLKRRCPLLTSAYVNKYINYFTNSLDGQFQEQISREEWTMILETPAPVLEYYKSYNPVVIKLDGEQRKTSKNPNAYSKGFIDGKIFDINIQQRLTM